jgi:hypothetical protein
MKPNLLLLCTALVTGISLAPAVHAQAGVYGVFTATRMGNLQSSPAATFTNANGGTKATIDVSGGTFGGYYDFKTLGPVRLGADLRGNFESSSRGAGVTAVGAGAHLYSVLGGVRGAFHTRYSFLEPYVQLSGGLGRSDYGLVRNVNGTTPPLNGAYALQNSFEFHVFAGADIHLASFLDFRVVELGYGGLSAFGNNSHEYPLRTVSTGLVFRLPTLK